MNIFADKCKKLILGRQGENLVTTIRFPIKRWIEEFGNGTFLLVHKRSQDKEAYPCATHLEGDELVWEIYASDVEHVGDGLAQLSLLIGEKVAKSEVFHTSTLRSLDATENPPEAWQAWVDQVLAATAHYPVPEDGTWRIWVNGSYIDTGVRAEAKDGRDGRDGVDGHTPVMTGSKEGKVNTISADGVPLINVLDGEGGGVSDVTVGGESVVTDGVAEIPIARTHDVFGLMQVRYNTGIVVGADGQLLTSSATQTNINGRNDSSGGVGRYYAPIVPSNLDAAVKAALTDGKGADYTDAEKAAARDRIGIGAFELIVDTTLENEVNEITFSKWSDNTDMNAKKLCVYIVVPITPESAKSMYPYFKTNATTSSGLGVNSFTYSSTSTPYCINFNMRVEDGLCFGERNIHSNYSGGNSVTSSSAAFIVSSNELQNIDKNNYIISARFRGRNVGTDDFPVGTRFILFGVRA